MAALDLAELDLAGAGEGWSVLRRAEPAVVDATALVGSSPASLEALRRLPTVTVAVGAPGAVDDAALDAVDVCLTTVDDPPRPWVAADVRGVEQAVAAQPEAALTLVALLRSAPAGWWEALVAESAAYAALLASRGFLRWLSVRGPAEPKPSVRPAVALDRDGDVLRVVLDRPEARNAFDSRLRDALVDALHLAAAVPEVAVELRGRGPCFSAGGDLMEFGGVGDPATAHAVRLTRHPGAALAAVAERTTAHLHGRCAGAGIEVPAFAAEVVADPASTFRLPELAFGLLPGAGGTVSIPRRVGRHRAAWLGLTGHELDAPTAHRWGLVDRLEPVRSP